MSRDDDAFCDYIGGRLADLPGVQAVSLGGSRAAGTHRPDSDWDFAVYYRGAFTPDSVRSLGWPGEVSEIGGWGEGVFNGGAWLNIEGRRTDVHYRDLDDVEHHLAEAHAGRFRIERLMFHLAGIPTYIVVAELALHRVLRGHLPKPSYPDALQGSAPKRWWNDAQMTLAYAREAHAQHGHLTDTAGAIATGACQTAHAVMAAQRQWVTNEKTLLQRAGLRSIDDVLAGLAPAPDSLVRAVDDVSAMLQAAATGSQPVHANRAR
jgi:predicted nucleotidyltransferase